VSIIIELQVKALSLPVSEPADTFRQVPPVSNFGYTIARTSILGRDVGLVVTDACGKSPNVSSPPCSGIVNVSSAKMPVNQVYLEPMNEA